MDTLKGRRSPGGEPAERLGLLAAAAHAQEPARSSSAEEADVGEHQAPAGSRSVEMGFLLARLPLDTFVAVSAEHPASMTRRAAAAWGSLDWHHSRCAACHAWEASCGLNQPSTCCRQWARPWS